MLKDLLVSIVYVNFNSTDLLINSIRSVQQHCIQVPYEILIVDNDSASEEVRKLSQWIEGQVNIRLILSGQNLGFGKANNLGASNAKGDYLFFLNPDTVVLNDVMRIFHDFLKNSGKNVAACGGNLLKPDLSPNDSYGNFPGPLLELCNVGVGLRFFFNDHYKKNIAIASPVHTDEIYMVPYVVGANVFIRAECFNEMQGFDEAYFMYYEETDLFHRLAKRGYSAYVLPEARIVHFEGASIGESREKFNVRKFKILLDSKLYYFQKWYPRYYQPYFRTLIFLQIITQFLKGKLGTNMKVLLMHYFAAIRNAKGHRALKLS